MGSRKSGCRLVSIAISDFISPFYLSFFIYIVSYLLANYISYVVLNMATLISVVDLIFTNTSCILGFM